jgi:hypothetical protein
MTLPKITAARPLGSPGAAGSRPTVCIRGHERTPENQTPQGKCRVCKNARNRRLKAIGRGRPDPGLVFQERPMLLRAGLAISDRFWARVEKTDRCWLWLGPKNDRGYGMFFFDGKRVSAARFSWLLRHGLLPPESLYACHTCDNPSCVNPDHIWLGTAADNMRDMILKGRSK